MIDLAFVVEAVPAELLASRPIHLNLDALERDLWTPHQGDRPALKEARSLALGIDDLRDLVHALLCVGAVILAS